MLKKLLFLFFLTIASTGFSQKSMKNLSAAPNPFAQQTTISFVSEIQQTAIISVRNVLGKTVFRKELEVKPGKNSIPFRREDLKAGMYIYAIQTTKETLSKRFVIK